MTSQPTKKGNDMTRSLPLTPTKSSPQTQSNQLPCKTGKGISMSNNIVHQKSSIKWVDPKVWKEKKRPMYSWADEVAKKHGFKTPVAATLKAIVACCGLDGSTRMTVKTISQKRALLFPGKPVSIRTIERHINILILHKTITRSDQEQWNRPVTTRLLRKDNVSRAQHDILSDLSYTTTQAVQFHQETYTKTHALEAFQANFLLRGVNFLDDLVAL
jgi:hypothetical protein